MGDFSKAITPVPTDRRAPSSANVFHDVKPGIVVRAIDNAITIDEHIG
jgi:hypothetical protein